MRVFDGQVGLLESAGLLVVSFLAYAMGYALPVFAAMLLIVWPLLLLHMLFQGLLLSVFAGIAALWRRGKPKPPPPDPPPPRRGAARFIWYMPLVTLTLGYLVQYQHTGTWFL